jgi:D-tyrosyl-tRNA(Tyr) deacylase
MRALVQRVSRAEVRVASAAVARIGKGLLVLLGVRRGDSEREAEYLARKVAELRIFEDAGGKLNLSLAEVGGEMLVVSQFTLYADCRKGRRPSFTEAAPPEEARRLYEHFCQAVVALGVPVATGVFQEMMEVELVNAGPVTLLVESV